MSNANNLKGKIVAKTATCVEPQRMYVVQFAATVDSRLKELMDGALIIPTHMNAAGNPVMVVGSGDPLRQRKIELVFDKSELAEIHFETTDATGAIQTTPIKYSQYPMLVHLNIIGDGVQYDGEVNFIDVPTIDNSGNMVTKSVPVARVSRKQFAPAKK